MIVTFIGVSSNISCIFCMVCFIILIRYFGGDENKRIPNKFRILALLIILTSIMTNIWFGILSWYPFITEHCEFCIKIINIITCIDMFIFQMFVLNRIEILFRYTPNGINSNLKLFDYYLLIIFYAIITFIFSTIILNQNVATFQIEYTMNIFIIQNIQHLILIILWINKLNKFNNWLNTLNSMNISYHIEFNNNIIYTFLSLYIIFIISHCISFYLLIKYEWSLFAISIMIKIITILLSFDVSSQTYNILDIDKNNSNWNIIYNQQQLLINNQTQQEIENRVENILNAYYANPHE